MRGNDVYLVYNAIEKIWASVSHDRGQTWSLHPIVHNTNSKLGLSLPSAGAVDSRGHVYFAWAGYTAHGKATGQVNLYVTKSTNGGVSWTTSLVEVSGSPPPCGCGGWAYWGAQVVLAVDAQDRI